MNLAKRGLLSANTSLMSIGLKGFVFFSFVIPDFLFQQLSKNQPIFKISITGKQIRLLK
jgi:hypothetical protein